MRVKLIANPVSGKGKGERLIETALSSLKRHGLSPDLALTLHHGHAAALAREAIGEFDLIAGLGGDGTMNEIASALMGTGVPLAVYPAGTGNDFIKALGKDLSYDDISSALADKRTDSVDIATANGCSFINVFGIGLDAVVSAEKARNGIPGWKTSYVFAMMRALARYRQYPLTVHINGETIHANALSLSVGNGAVCGGVFRLTPDALVDDGLLDITILSDFPLSALPFHIHKAFNGNIAETPFTRQFRARSLTVSAEDPLPSHVDGDVLEPYAERYEIEVLPGALTVIRP